MKQNNKNFTVEGTLILLSGPTSVGKTSIAKALQQLGHTRGEEILHIEADHFIPYTYSDKSWEDSDFKIRMIVASIRAANSYCLQNFDVILDGILPYGDKMAKEAALAEFNKIRKRMYIGVSCDIQEIKKRVELRGNRDLQHATAQANNLHDGERYDILLDSTDMDATRLAEIVGQKLWPQQ